MTIRAKMCTYSYVCFAYLNVAHLKYSQARTRYQGPSPLPRVSEWRMYGQFEDRHKPRHFGPSTRWRQARPESKDVHRRTQWTTVHRKPSAFTLLPVLAQLTRTFVYPAYDY